MSQEPVLVRMSEIVPRTVTEEVWRSMYVTRRLIAQYWKTPGCPGCREPRRKEPQQNADSRQDQMSNTSEGKTKLDEEQKRRDALHSQKDECRHHTFQSQRVPSSNIEHEGRAQPSKRARKASEADSLDSTAMQDVATQGPPKADTASETNMRGSSKRQADVGVEELEQDANDGSNEVANIG